MSVLLVDLPHVHMPSADQDVCGDAGLYRDRGADCGVSAGDGVLRVLLCAGDASAVHDVYDGGEQFWGGAAVSQVVGHEGVPADPDRGVCGRGVFEHRAGAASDAAARDVGDA